MNAMNSIELELSYFAPGSSSKLPDGKLHRKTVPCCIFCQALEGRYEIRCEGRFERIDPGEAFLTPPSKPMEITHRSMSKTRNTMSARWVHFDFQTQSGVEALSLLEMPLRVPAKEAAPIGELVAEALELKAAELNPLLAEARRQELAYGILRRLCELCEPREGAMEILGDKRLAALSEAIRREPGRNCDVKGLAKAAGVSAPRLHSFLREKLGMTPMEFARRIKMRLAAEELMAGDLKLEALAAKLGFANQFHFSRVFKSFYAEAPSEYRKKRFGATS